MLTSVYLWTLKSPSTKLQLLSTTFQQWLYLLRELEGDKPIHALGGGANDLGPIVGL